jgi:hypothetical protein
MLKIWQPFKTQAKVNIFAKDLKNRFENGSHLPLNACFATYKEVGAELKVCT